MSSAKLKVSLKFKAKQQCWMRGTKFLHLRVNIQEELDR